MVIRDRVVIEVTLVIYEVEAAFAPGVGVTQVIIQAPLADGAGVDVEDLAGDGPARGAAGVRADASQLAAEEAVVDAAGGLVAFGHKAVDNVGVAVDAHARVEECLDLRLGSGGADVGELEEFDGAAVEAFSLLPADVVVASPVDGRRKCQTEGLMLGHEAHVVDTTGCLIDIWHDAARRAMRIESVLLLGILIWSVNSLRARDGLDASHGYVAHVLVVVCALEIEHVDG